MGCHGGLNVADTLGGSGGTYLDWPQLYARTRSAMYIANTGFGYGDSASVALSERLLVALRQEPALRLGLGRRAVGCALQQYFATAGAYDVYDEKVMEETTFYGLPFWHFGTRRYAPALHAADDDRPTRARPAARAQRVNVPERRRDAQTQFGLYRPNLPITSQEVTSSRCRRAASGSTTSSTSDARATATLGYPTIDLAANEPKPNVDPIFFPASPFTLEHSIVFGKQRDFVNVSGQFRPDRSARMAASSGTSRRLASRSSTRIAPTARRR